MSRAVVRRGVCCWPNLCQTLFFWLSWFGLEFNNLTEIWSKLSFLGVKGGVAGHTWVCQTHFLWLPQICTALAAGCELPYYPGSVQHLSPLRDLCSELSFWYLVPKYLSEQNTFLISTRWSHSSIKVMLRPTLPLPSLLSMRTPAV